VRIHELPTAGQARGCDVRAFRRDISRPLIVDSVRPTSLNQVRQGEPHEQIAKRGWVQDARIVDRDSSHWSVAHIQVLTQGLKFVECGMAPGLQVLLVGE
jgi:hypothetical protein